MGNQMTLNRKFINSAVIKDDVGIIELWGDIFEERPRDWWTDEELDIQCITPKDFKEALANVTNASKIELHLNSCGGDATVGLTIGNLIKKSNKHFTCIVDGLAASAAFTIAMSCDEVQVYKSSILMLHEVKSLLWGYYGNEDLARIENGNDSYNRATASVYADKSGMSTTQILNLMRKETWMTGQDAIDYGFADSIVQTEKGNQPLNIEMVNKGRLRVNGVQFNVKGLHVPEEILNSSKIVQKTNIGGQKQMSTKTNQIANCFQTLANYFKNSSEEDSQEENGKKKKTEDDGNDENKNATQENKANFEELKKQAIEAERKRLQEIDEMSKNIPSELVQEAKYGQSACSASDLALRAIQFEKETVQKSLNSMVDDTNNSQVNLVSSEPPKTDKNTQNMSPNEKLQDARAEVRRIMKLVNKKDNGGK